MFTKKVEETKPVEKKVEDNKQETTKGWFAKKETKETKSNDFDAIYEELEGINEDLDYIEKDVRWLCTKMDIVLSRMGLTDE